jgi:flavin-dependent dehydrogenase
MRAGFVVGADGANSLVRRRLAAPFRRDQLSIATGYFVEGVTSDEIVLEFVADPPGYIWSFPRPTHLAVGICAQADAGTNSAALRTRTDAWLRKTRLAADARLTAYAWPIPSLAAGDFRTLTLAGPRWALVGDAAGLVDPITREGIFYALRSAELLATALAAAGAEKTYRVSASEEIGTELRRAARLKRGFFRPGFTQLMLDGLAASAGVRSVMADLVAGRVPYDRLKWRLARTLEAGLAWRWLTATARA